MEVRKEKMAQASETKKFWRMETKIVKGEANDEKRVGEILLYGVLSEFVWFDDEISSKMFADELRALGDVAELNVRINSTGGDVFAGTAIYSMLRSHKAAVTVHVDGLAASAASVVAMAGDTVVMPGNALMMIHNPWTFAAGDSDELRKNADTLDVIREGMVAAYHAKTGLGRQKIIAMMDAETWMTAEDAVSLGFADVAKEPLNVAASLRGKVLEINGEEFDLSGFKNAPTRLRSAKKEEMGLDKETEVNGAATPPQAQSTAPDAVPQAGVPMQTAAFDLERFKTENPEAYAAAFRAGALHERARQEEIDALASPGLEEIVKAAKYASDDTPERVAVAIVKAQKEQGMKEFNARRGDARTSGIQDLSVQMPPDGMGVGGDDNAAHAAAIRNEIKKGRGLA